MIYLDCAATSLQKPRAVYRAVRQAMEGAGGYGRSGHKPALYAGELVYHCRETACRLFGLQAPEQVVFTLNATHALNQAIHALVGPDTKVAVSGYEHNSVMRPLYARGVPVRVLESGPFDPGGLLLSAERALDEGVRLFIVNHVSNVFGGVAPVGALDALLGDAGAALILDASQSAGAVGIDVSTLPSLAAVCMPGHKGLLGPQGTGLLLVCSDALQRPLLQGGTGSLSQDLQQPDFLPDRLESGTPNVPGIAGLAEGMAYVLRRGPARILAHEQRLLAALKKGLDALPDVEVFASPDPQGQAGVLSFRHARIPCETLAEQLAGEGICVRAGLHCAPLAHRSAGTLDSGTVRVSLGPFHTRREIGDFIAKLCEILEKI